MAVLIYPGVVEHPDAEGGSYGLWFPDFPGCVTAGDSLAELDRNAREALNFHIEGMIEDKETLPEPSDAKALGDFAALMFVRADIADEAAIRINITLPEGLLSRIDAAVDASGRGATRSGFLADAARSALGARRTG